MHSHRPRAAHHSHHSSLSHFDDIKVLQAELAKQAQFDSLDAPPRNISSAQATPQATPKQPLATIASRPHSSARFVPAAWNPVFLDKPAQYRRWLVGHPNAYPVCTLHLAAIAIQRWWRRLGRARRTKRSRRRIEHVPTWQHPWQQLARSINAQCSAEHSAAAAVAGGHASSRQQQLQNAVSFDDYCAAVIQRAWRASRERRHRQYVRRPMYRIAAGSIQRWWRDKLVELGKKRSRPELAARTIQRAYRGYSDRKIYRFFRQLLLSRQNADPARLLRALQAGDGALNDAASGLYVRLRLGGTSFPPLVYYKVFTSQRVLDLNSFAPRQYALDEQRRRAAKQPRLGQSDGGGDSSDAQCWYRRWANNGWRVVGGHLLLERREDEVECATAAARTYHHPNRQVRRVDAERRRRDRRVAWMKQLYARGHESEGRSEQKEESKEQMDMYELTRTLDAMIGRTKADRRQAESEAAAAGREEEQAEEDVDSLIDWASRLCFDDYEQQWSKVGATRPAKRDKAAPT